MQKWNRYCIKWGNPGKCGAILMCLDCILTMKLVCYFTIWFILTHSQVTTNNIAHEEPLNSKVVTQTCQTRKKFLATTVSNKFVKKEKSNLTVTKERQKKEDHLSTIFMGYVLVFLVCHTPRLVLSFYELTAIRSALECNK